MKILNENARWWKGIEKEWAFRDGKGKWWIYKKQKKNKVSSALRQKKKEEGSSIFSTEDYAIIALASALGVSLVLNVLAILT
tara:strand:+ start:179 stop:424 length:246 start_codon:yes stop_codon:yes gene_type:complete